MASEITKEEMRERLGNIDQIRDIIFGPQLREYESRFDKLESNLSMLQQEMLGRVEQVKTAVSTELRAAVESIDKKIKSLSLNSQEEIADLRQQIERTNKKFTNSIESLDENIDQQTTSIREDLTQSREKLHDEVNTLKTQIFEELERRFSLLKEMKVSKDDMAELLFELGMRLKGTEFVQEVTQVGKKDLDELPLLTQIKSKSSSSSLD
jgi:exonuclease VII large subunit